MLHNMVEGIVLIFLLQWIFLGNLRTAVIVSATIRLALAFAIGLMLIRGESANLLSVGAIDFGLVGRTAQVSNAYSNQTELATLFYVLTILAWFTHHARTVFVVLAWLFVVFRLLHAFVHVTSNRPNLRGMMFGFGSVVLAIMWGIFMIEVVITGGWRSPL